jgi:two-component system response regulator HydG
MCATPSAPFAAARSTTSRKPVDLEQLLDHVQRVLGHARVPPPGTPDLPLPPGIVVESEGMRRVVRDAALVAPSEARVLITGESGVGKEVVADLIHRWSPRAAKPLVTVNCAAIPENLLESELFGHEKGAFTGATSLRIGRFEEAHGGTILLDEIGEMDPALQSKLLRVTQNGSFHRVGSNRERHADVRILAATNRNLEQEVAEGRFREDLFYRLNVIEIYVPSLRDRRADIPALATHFARSFGQGRARFSPGSMQALEAHAWPGNVRELRNAMERAVLLARGDVILPEHLPKRVQESGAQAAPASLPPDAAGGRMEDIERAAILQALAAHDYNRTATAAALSISRRALTYKLRTYREQGHPIDPE